MKVTAISNLSTEERKEVIEAVKECGLEEGYKKAAVEALEVCNKLLEELKTSKMSIGRLKQLIGFRSEQLKKMQQSH